MLRGVYKLAIEVIDIENEHFDRAILFVKSSCSGMEKSLMDSSARDYLSGISYKPQTLSRGRKIFNGILTVFKWVSAAAVGAVLSIFLMQGI